MNPCEPESSANVSDQALSFVPILLEFDRLAPPFSIHFHYSDGVTDVCVLEQAILDASSSMS